MTEGPVRLNKKNSGKAAGVMARAFSDYPMFTYYFPEDDLRAKFLSHFFVAGARCCIKYGELQATSSEVEGVAGWLGPGNFPLGRMQGILSIPANTLIGMMRSGIERIGEVTEFLDEMHGRCVPRPHWYLQVSRWSRGCRAKVSQGS